MSPARSVRRAGSVFGAWLILCALFAFGCRTLERKPDKSRDLALQEEAGVIETAKGTIVIKFYPGDAPKTVENFKKLAREKFYDGLTFWRVEKDPVPFVIQGGDPNGDGTGGPGYGLPPEFNARPHLEGTVAMARGADVASAGSQFYICLAPQPALDGKYTVFGQTVEGFDVIHQIEKGDVMKSVRIESRARAL